MTLIKSISGIRGTIGGTSGEGLTPVDIVKFSSAYGTWLNEETGNKRNVVIVGRDARISGEMVSALVSSSLLAMGIDVKDIGLATTPTVEMAVIEKKADGGIIITASHNPGEWNALKLLNGKGEFLSDSEGKKIVDIADCETFVFTGVEDLGKLIHEESFHAAHIEKILKLPLVDIKAIKKAHFRVAVDCVNSVGALIIPDILYALGVEEVIELYCEPNGIFPHNPEPVPANLKEICSKVKESGADLGFVVDPDVDRLAIVNEDGTLFGEEYTLVAVADYILGNNPGDTVSNLSSTMALRDITLKHGGKYYSSPVGEVNVVAEMKKRDAVIGGEGNGGVIYPGLHYGRDAMVGVALFLSYLAKSGKSCLQLRNTFPDYEIVKTRQTIEKELDISTLKEKLKKKFPGAGINMADGIRLDLDKKWLHIRKSNTEPVFRIIAESESIEQSEALIEEIKELLNSL